MAEPITRNAYAVLGVTPESHDQEIATAYRDLARRYHPDIAGEATTERMMRVNAAFERVRTRERRAEYDREVERNGGVETPSRPESDGTGAAGPPPGRPSGSVLAFGRHLGWTIGEIARADPGYLVWLEERREGRAFVLEIDQTLRSVGYRVDRNAPAPERRRQ